MKKIELDEQKKIELDILVYIDHICRVHNINYSLCAGTLLGAVRHKGFIPWDDDIDIFLIRKEYERLIKILSKDNNYLLIAPENNGYYCTFSKLICKQTIMVMNNPQEPPIPQFGIFVDIFPIDGLPSEAAKQANHIQYLNKLHYNMRMSMKSSYYLSATPIKAIIKKFLKYPEHRRIIKESTSDKWKYKLLVTMKKYDFDNSNYAGFVLSAYGDREILPKDTFIGVKEMEFEGRQFYVYKNYERYLTSIYGDYMRLPPKSQQRTTHEYTAYWKEVNQNE